jgi:hypothetical protein
MTTLKPRGISHARPKSVFVEDANPTVRHPFFRNYFHHCYQFARQFTQPIFGGCDKLRLSLVQSDGRTVLLLLLMECS